MRSDCSYMRVASSHQHAVKKGLGQFAPMIKIVLRGNDKLHMTSQLRKAIMLRS